MMTLVMSPRIRARNWSGGTEDLWAAGKPEPGSGGRMVRMTAGIVAGGRAQWARSSQANPRGGSVVAQTSHVG